MIARDGAVTRLAMYSALAEQWAAPLIDLVEQPIDERLVGDTPATEWMRRGWVPVERDADGGLLVATTVRLNDARLTEIAREYGAVAVRLHNDGGAPFFVEAGERIAQGLIVKADRHSFEWVDALSDTERGEGGFGSTGRT